MKNKLPEIWTADDVAKYLKIGRVKAYKLLKEGFISSFYVGERNIRTTNAAVADYLNRINPESEKQDNKDLVN